MQIEKSIPCPTDEPGASKYPFSKMEPGDSVFVTGDKKTQNKARVAARVYSHRTGKKFIARKSGDGVRIWRA